MKIYGRPCIFVSIAKLDPQAERRPLEGRLTYQHLRWIHGRSGDVADDESFGVPESEIGDRKDDVCLLLHGQKSSKPIARF